MTIEELQKWIDGLDGLRQTLTLLSRYAAARQVSVDETPNEIAEFEPDWPRLLLAGSVLAASESERSSELALMIAEAGLLFGKDRLFIEASATLLTQLSNQRSVDLAVRRDYLDPDLEARVGICEQMLLARRELDQSIFTAHGERLTTNRFQRKLWDELQRASWVSASAPTASGKTFLVLQWLLDQFATKENPPRLAVFIAPTRALVGEIERQLLEMAGKQNLTNCRIASLPLTGLGDGSKPTILVFTQERLHVFLNASQRPPPFDLAIVDEAHKVGDGLRGVVLQDAIERLVRVRPACRLVFLSPLTKNPETLVRGAAANSPTAVVPSHVQTVIQNLVLAEQAPGHSDVWNLSLRRLGETHDLGEIRLHAKPDTQLKRLSYVALALGRKQSGTLVYANGAADAEKIAWQIFEGLGSEFQADEATDEELTDLSDFAKATVHPNFQLVELVKRGVAFHYGNMPTLLRSEIERLFAAGKIRYLVCTSTLVEGVNLACRTIVVRGPRKGKTTPMGPHDFWNLAGRAGRWGQDFSGNIVCVDVNRPKLWPSGVPERTLYPIERETETVLNDRETMIQYLDTRSAVSPAEVVAPLEYVSAYLMAWRARAGSLMEAPTAVSLPDSYVQALDGRIKALLESVEIPAEIIGRHTGVSGVAMQTLLNYFRKRKKPVEELVPTTPESDDAYGRLIAIFTRINSHLYPAFNPRGLIPVYALVTINWMRGIPLGQIIRNRVAYMEEHGRAFQLAALIRDTMRDVEEVARFKAPKYLAVYMDILRYHLQVLGQEDLIPEELRFDLYLEFGVSTETLLSLIGLGLSRTSAIALNEFLANDRMSEDAVFSWLQTRRWETQDMPMVAKREIGALLERRKAMTA